MGATNNLGQGDARMQVLAHHGAHLFGDGLGFGGVSRRTSREETTGSFCIPSSTSSTRRQTRTMHDRFSSRPGWNPQADADDDFVVGIR